MDFESAYKLQKLHGDVYLEEKRIEASREIEVLRLKLQFETQTRIKSVQIQNAKSDSICSVSKPQKTIKLPLNSDSRSESEKHKSPHATNFLETFKIPDLIPKIKDQLKKLQSETDATVYSEALQKLDQMAQSRKRKSEECVERTSKVFRSGIHFKQDLLIATEQTLMKKMTPTTSAVERDLCEQAISLLRNGEKTVVTFLMSFCCIMFIFFKYFSHATKVNCFPRFTRIRKVRRLENVKLSFFVIL